MASSKRLEVIIAGDAKGAKDAFKDTEKGAESLGSRMTSSLGDSGRKIGLAAAAGVVGVGIALEGAWKAAEESAKIARETERVIKSTGGAANVTADQVSSLATSISDLTGIDDEAVQSVENLMLTFTGVKNVVGAGNDIFTQSIGLTEDMATVLGTDASGAAIQLGKALNDPIKGITALSRAGVSFTEQQKEQIKTLVAAGDTLGAQKIILAELTKEFGGAAAAAGTPLDKLKVQIGNIQEAIGAKLIPIVQGAAAWLGENLPKAFDALSAKWEEIRPTVESAAAAIGNAAIVMGGHIKDAVEWLTKPENDAALKGVVATIGVLLVGAFVALGVAAAQAAIGVIAATWPLLLIAAVVGGLVFVITKAWQESETFRNAVFTLRDGLLSFYNDVLIPLWAFMQDKWNTVWPIAVDIFNWFKDHLPEIKEAFRTLYEDVLKPMLTFIADNKESLRQFAEAIAVIGAVVLVVSLIITGTFIVALVSMGVVLGMVGIAIAAFIIIVMRVINVMWDWALNTWNATGQIRDALSPLIGLWNTLLGVVLTVVGGIVGASLRMAGSVEEMRGKVEGSIRGTINAIASLPGEIIGFFSGAGGWLVAAGQAIVEGFRSGFLGRIGALKSDISGALGSIADLFPHSPAKEGPFSGKGFTTYSGEALALGFAQGIESGMGKVHTAVNFMMSPTPLAPAVPARLGARPAGAGGTVHVTVNGYVGDEEALGRAITRQLVAAQRAGVAVPWAS